ncbi:hypothetical protein Tcan_12545 [Toxocara canis]|uniref:Uncharacterized protein n=1 Tax=Toxocara canis TaxID=6265 RepID=A0A0B2UPF1_TOXCA|nr:hypothetical protein Tcan_12545 [Toxocara canis]
MTANCLCVCESFTIKTSAMPLWRYAHAIHRYAKLFLRLRGLAITRKVTPTVAARIRPKLITRAATMGQLRGVVKKSSGSIVQQFRVAFRNLVALHYAPPIAYKHAHARENLQVALEHRFRKIAGRQIRLSAFDRIRVSDLDVYSNMKQQETTMKIGEK